MQTVPRFIVTGIIGFAVDAAVFLFMDRVVGVTPYLARIPAFLIAVGATYALNRNWTFAARHVPHRSGFGAYLTAQSAGIALNYAVFAGLIAMSGWFARFPVAAIFAGSLAAALFNYGAARRIFMRGR